MRIALENLLGNAFKFTSTRATAVVELNSVTGNGEEMFYVRDNGVGFDMSYSPKLFKPFERLHGEGTFEGLGVGLTTVQRIIGRHGGRIRAEGTTDQGATFYFSLPTKDTTHHGHHEQNYCFS